MTIIHIHIYSFITAVNISSVIAVVIICPAIIIDRFVSIIYAIAVIGTSTGATTITARTCAFICTIISARISLPVVICSTGLPGSCSSTSSSQLCECGI
jgi:hypothetical protein